ncbi:hypothetical protein HYH03_000351 [Edaphochlamys debaryana]|uniref:Uncharacterized protein n=1 Tax=Edaphochlamys debaryana TaxID=47281 RepID=A0A836C744_9CHLO|nr:hypothetical protein HYH03_000351 [Edaphochlamys debaryana]|eukprot:KAG2501853.1 hypothetical protein HYH03_000351 [Edaphochlamys debaryana]
MAGTLLTRSSTKEEVVRAVLAEEGGAATVTTVGKCGHFKVWSLSLSPGRGRDAQQQAALTPRPTNLKEFRTASFVACAASPGSPAAGGQPAVPALLYALTQGGVLITMRPATRALDKSVNLQVPTAFALAVSPSLVACACAAGVVRLFAARSLEFRGNLPRPNTRAGAGAGAGAEASAGALFPDAVGCSFDSAGERLTVVYSDRSIVVWDVRNPAKPVRYRSVLSHSGVVWSAALIPPWQAALLGPAGAGMAPTPGATPGGEPAGPSSVLCTCGTDGTVRLWNVCLDNSASTAGPMGVPADMAAAAKVTRTLRAIIHASPPPGAAQAPAPNRRCAPDAPLPVPGGAANNAPAPVSLRCLRVSPCGRHLATGDSRGNIRVYSLATLQLLLLREAHDAEVLSLDYSPPALDGTMYLASGSRDMLVHVFEVSRGYELVGTCDAHGGAVTAVRFSSSGSRLALLSCSADKSVVFRHVQLGPAGLDFSLYHTEKLPRGAVLYDIAVDSTGGRAVAVGADGQLRLFDVATGRPIRSFSGDSACGEAVSVVLDPSGCLAVCSCADGAVAVYDLDSGQLLARGAGHGDVATSAVLLEDYRGLMSVGGDGCCLLWRLGSRLARRMHDAAAAARRQLEQQAAQQAALVAQTPALAKRKAWGNAADGAGPGGGGAPQPQPVEVDMSATMLRVAQGKPLLSVDKLPRWAQERLTEDAQEDAAAALPPGPPAGTTAAVSSGPAPAAMPAGKWAQRMAQPPAPAPGLAPAGSAGPVASLAAVDAAAAEGSPSTAAAIAARAGALTGQPRTWAQEVDDDDETLMFCEELEGEEALAAGTAGVVLFGQPPRPQTAPGGGFEVRQEAAVAAEAGAKEEEEQVLEVEEEAREDSRSATEAVEDPASVCASNRLGGAPAAAEEELDGDADGVKRDLFREHFDSLGLDQGSATKALPAPDPRRQSLSLMYRQARAGATGTTGAAPSAGRPTSPPLAVANPPALTPAPGAAANGTLAGAGAGAGAGGMGDGAGAGGGTPLLARMPLPASVTAVRGGAAAEDLDGAVTSAAWTPERAMLPLTSPVLATADKQLEELQRMRARLLASTLRRKPDAAASAGAVAAAPDCGAPAGAAAAAAPVPAAPVPTAATSAQPCHSAAVTLAPAAAPAAGGSRSTSPASAPASQPQGQGQPPLPPQPAPAPTAMAAPSPSFSSLSGLTPALAVVPGPAGSTTPTLVTRRPAAAAAAQAPAAATPAGAMMVTYNPMYGTTPCDPTPAPVLGFAPPGRGLAAAAAPPPPASADEVIRAVLQAPSSAQAAGGSAGGDDAVDAAGGVCVVTQAGAAADKLGAGSLGDGARKARPALPTIRSRTDSPRAEATAAAAAALPTTAAATAEACAEALARLQQAVRDVSTLYAHLSASGPGPGPDAAQRLREAALGAAAQLGSLGTLPVPAPPAPAPAPGGAPLAPYGQPPPAEACSSPRTASASAAAPAPGPLPLQPAYPGAPAPSASRDGGVGSSQVLLEVGLVESLVEEKLHARMAEELRRVEEAVMARLLASMGAGAGGQAPLVGVAAGGQGAGQR